MKTVIIHGKRISPQAPDPRAGREECELWGCTQGNVKFWGGQLTSWTRWFDIHPLVKTADFDGIPARRPDAWAWYRAQDGTRPIYLQAPEEHPDHAIAEARRLFDQVPGAVAFPIRELQRAYLVNGEPNRNFRCQIGMMIAFATLLCSFEKIICNGVGMSNRIDFQIAHKDTDDWIWFARGRGLTVEIEGASTHHMPTKIYAYEKLNWVEVAMARSERPYDELKNLHEINQRELRRGRPIRHRIPVFEG